MYIKIRYPYLEGDKTSKDIGGALKNNELRHCHDW